MEAGGKGKGNDGKNAWDSGKGNAWKTKGKGKGHFPWACHGCGEIGHRVADCPKNDPTKAVNPLSESQEEDWEDENGDEGWGSLTGSLILAATPVLPTPTKNRWEVLRRDDE